MSHQVNQHQICPLCKRIWYYGNMYEKKNYISESRLKIDSEIFGRAPLYDICVICNHMIEISIKKGLTENLKTIANAIKSQKKLTELYCDMDKEISTIKDNKFNEFHLNDFNNNISFSFREDDKYFYIINIPNEELHIKKEDKECSCPKWKYKEIKTTCACGGVVYYQKINKIDERDEKKLILEKLKKKLQEKRTNITILKMEIRELENEINDECRDTSTEDETSECILSNGAVVSKAGLPNCDCRSCN